MGTLAKVALLLGAVAVVAIERHTIPIPHSEQSRAQERIPNPRIDYIHLNGSPANSVMITYSESVIVKLQATNTGTGIGYMGGVYMSFREFDSYADADYVDLRSNSDNSVYHEFRPGDPSDPIWYLSLGEFLPAQVLLIGARYDVSSSYWDPGETVCLEVEVRPPSPGTYQVYLKVPVCDSEGFFHFDPASGTYTDQQGEYVYRRTIEVMANPNSIYLPVVLRDYSPPTPIRGVRMQASGCSTEDKCEQTLDCLQTAGVNTLYYTIYWQEAYYHSDLLPHHSFDSLAYLVPEAHARDIEVYALISAADIGWPEHPEWNARLNHPGVDDDWLDFAVPEARSFVADVAEELVTNYDVDGILLDYIRWRTDDFDTANLSANDISLTVQGVYERVEVVRPIAVTASTFMSQKYGSWAGQMWYDWLSGGYIDYVTPMAYVDDSELQTLLDEWRDSGYFPERIIPRLSVVWFDPVRPKPVEDVLRQIEICYDSGATAMTLWDNRYICNNPDLVEALGAGGW